MLIEIFIKERSTNMNELINVDYYPSIPRTEIVKKSKYRFSINELSSLGSGFGAAASALNEVKISNMTGGLYRCYFPRGIEGHLASAKDGSGFLGTILNEKGIAAQARWIPASGKALTVTLNPSTLVIGAALMSVNHKLDQIQETQTEILKFLNQDKESKLEGAVNSLADILEQYRFNSDNEFWKSSKLTAVTNIKGVAENNIIFYRKEITSSLEKQKKIHGYYTADKLKNKLEHEFKYYQLSVYISAYASFLEVMLSGNFSKEYLNHMIEKIRNYAYQYRVDYTKCYEQLNEYMKVSVPATALGGLGNVSKATGKAIAKIPVINKGPVDEALITAGSKIKGLGAKHGKKAMKEFRNSRDAGIQFFLSSIEVIDTMSNHPVELFFDNENVYYLCE